MERPPPLNVSSTDTGRSVAECDHIFVRLDNMRANATHFLQSLETVELTKLLTKFDYRPGPGLTDSIEHFRDFLHRSSIYIDLPGHRPRQLLNSSIPKTNILAS